MNESEAKKTYREEFRQKYPTVEDRLYFLQFLNKSLYEMDFLDIRRAMDGKSLMGAFILATCFIEHMAGFRYGKRETGGKDFKEFVKNYLPEYDPEKLWNDLRCKLVHNYSEGGSYSFVNSKPDLHLSPNSYGKLTLNLESFVDEVEAAYKKYYQKLNDDEELQLLAYKRFSNPGILASGFIGMARP